MNQRLALLTELVEPGRAIPSAISPDLQGPCGLQGWDTGYLVIHKSVTFPDTVFKFWRQQAYHDRKANVLALFRAIYYKL